MVRTVSTLVNDVLTPAPGSADVGAQTLRLLLVEDSPRLQQRLKSLLEKGGAVRVESVVDSATAARRAIDRQFFDVLIVDVELAEGSGIDVVAYARQHFPTQKKPLIIVLTNYAIPAVEKRCRQAGADYFLDKMHQFSEVMTLILRWRNELNGLNG